MSDSDGLHTVSNGSKHGSYGGRVNGKFEDRVSSVPHRSKWDGIVVRFDEPYPRGWKLLHVGGRLTPRPRGFRQWARVVWGWDVFAGPVPVVKVCVASAIVSVLARVI